MSATEAYWEILAHRHEQERDEAQAAIERVKKLADAWEFNSPNYASAIRKALS